MNGNCQTCDIEYRCGYEYKPCDCCNYRKYRPKYGWTAVHLKTGNEYTVVGEAINCTNAQDGQHVVIYTREGQTFVREVHEFQNKFKAKEGA